MKIKLSLILFCCFCLATNASEEMTDFKPFDSTYILKRDDSIVGEIKRSLTKNQQNYTFRSDSKTTGLVALFYKNTVNELTTWQMQEGKFRPIHYQYYRDKNGKERMVKIDFDWEKQRIITNAEGSNWTMDLSPGIYDKLLYQIVIMKRLQKKQRIDEFQIADGGQIKTYSFKHLGSETITTPLGKLDTVKLERHKSNSDKTLTIWYAMDMNYLPVKVENIDNDGKTITAIINQLNYH